MKYQKVSTDIEKSSKVFPKEAESPKPLLSPLTRRFFYHRLHGDHASGDKSMHITRCLALVSGLTLLGLTAFLLGAQFGTHLQLRDTADLDAGSTLHLTGDGRLSVDLPQGALFQLDKFAASIKKAAVGVEYTLPVSDRQDLSLSLHSKVPVVLGFGVVGATWWETDTSDLKTNTPLPIEQQEYVRRYCEANGGRFPATLTQRVWEDMGSDQRFEQRLDERTLKPVDMLVRSVSLDCQLDRPPLSLASSSVAMPLTVEHFLTKTLQSLMGSSSGFFSSLMMTGPTAESTPDTKKQDATAQEWIPSNLEIMPTWQPSTHGLKQDVPAAWTTIEVYEIKDNELGASKVGTNSNEADSATKQSNDSLAQLQELMNKFF